MYHQQVHGTKPTPLFFAKRTALVHDCSNPGGMGMSEPFWMGSERGEAARLRSFGNLGGLILKIPTEGSSGLLMYDEDIPEWRLLGFLGQTDWWGLGLVASLLCSIYRTHHGAPLGWPSQPVPETRDRSTGPDRTPRYSQLQYCVVATRQGRG